MPWVVPVIQGVAAVGGAIAASQAAKNQAQGGGNMPAPGPSGANEGQANQLWMNEIANRTQQQQLLDNLKGQTAPGAQQDILELLTNQAKGIGVSPAQAQLAQALMQNIGAQSAMAAGQRGASANAGLIARQAGLAGATAQQQAAGQMATLRANEQLGAMQGAGNLAQGMIGNRLQAQGQMQEGDINAQRNILSALGGANQTAAQMYQAQMSADAEKNKGSSGIIGSLINAGGGALSALGSMGGKGGGTTPTPTGTITPASGNNPGSQGWYDWATAPNKAEGGMIDGHAQVPGDSPKNDTVHAMLSPGEVVLPRSVVNAKDPGEAARKFVEAIKKKQGMNEGGEVKPDEEKRKAVSDAFKANTGSQGLSTALENLKNALGMKNYYNGTGREPNGVVPNPDVINLDLSETPDVSKIQNATMGNIPMVASDMIKNAQPPAPAPVTITPSVQTKPDDSEIAKALAPDKAPSAPANNAFDILQQKSKEIENINQRGIKAYETEAALLGKQAKSNQQILQEQMKLDADLTQAATARQQEIAGEMDKIQDELKNGKIDANKYWDDVGIMGRISSIAGILMSGIGAGMSGKENMAMKYIDKAIEQNIDAQKANYQNKSNLYGQLRQRLGDDRAATDALRALYKSTAANKMAEVSYGLGGPMAQAKMEQITAPLRAQAAEYTRQRALDDAIKVTEKQAMSNPELGDTLVRLLRDKGDKRADEIEKRIIPGIGIARTEEDAKKMKDVKGAANSSVAAINDLISLAKKGSNFSPEDRAQAYTIAESMKGSLNKALLGGGPISPAEREILDSVVKDPLAIFSMPSGKLASFKALRNRVRQGISGEASARGLRYNPINDLSPQQKLNLQEAMKNPKHPKSIELFEQLGLD